MPPESAAQAEHAPAKINLALHVTGQRPDGYHLIESLSVFTVFGDRVAIAAADADTFSVTGPFGGTVPTGTDNLVLKARDALRSRYPSRADTGLAIILEKNIPAVSGVGGGSSDAAATIRAMVRLSGLDPDDPALARMAEKLGADVPMCLAARPLVARGIGERLEFLSAFPVLHLVLANPGIAVETPRVFAALASRHNDPLPPVPAGRSATALVAWLETTRNDLFAPALSLAPVIGDVLTALTAGGAAVARMSGSGATCFGIFADAGSAARAATAIRTAEPGWFATATVTTL